MELALLRAIQELPGRQRAVLIFRDVLGWTAPEVAEVLESTVASVTSALQRARGTIDQHLPEATQPARGSGRARAAQSLCGCVRARRHGRAGGAAARGRDATDAAATVAEWWSADRALLPRDRRPRRSDADTTPTDLGERPARGDDRSASATTALWIPHGISVLVIDGGQIVGIDAFLDPTLLPRFGVPAGR